MPPQEAVKDPMSGYRSAFNSDLLTGVLLQKAEFLSKMGDRNLPMINKVPTCWPITQSRQTRLTAVLKTSGKRFTSLSSIRERGCKS